MVEELWACLSSCIAPSLTLTATSSIWSHVHVHYFSWHRWSNRCEWSNRQHSVLARPFWVVHLDCLVHHLDNSGIQLLGLHYSWLRLDLHLTTWSFRVHWKVSGIFLYTKWMGWPSKSPHSWLGIPFSYHVCGCNSEEVLFYTLLLMYVAHTMY